MQSKIAEAVKLLYHPVAVTWTDEKPENALQFKEGRWGCVIGMLNAAASKGKTAVFDRKTFGCLGGGTGLGFGNQYQHFPGGIEYFLSTGNKKLCNKNFNNMPALGHGERYIKTPEIAAKFVESLPVIDIPNEYVVFKPLEQVDEGEKPVVIVFLARPDELSALVVLANYARETNNNVTIPMGAGCHTIGIFPYKEAEKEIPAAVVGLTDISARNKVEKDVLSFAVPYKMFEEMENNIEGSFLEQEPWTKIVQRNK
ncbi:MAG: DUF169 domain-containing protein [Clostridiales bacterium]|nr:DUF169 domain-containing protein [Clostridiales bacterium]MCF8023624.1 DUF169 domain-containing protein [Clostridiales bacterium]